MSTCLLLSAPRPAAWGWPAAVLALGMVLSGCSGDTTGPRGSGEPPVLRAEVEIFDSHASQPDPSADATCQTGAQLAFRARNPDGASYDPRGEELTYIWFFEVDRGDGFERAPDLPPAYNPWVTQDVEINLRLDTIGLHKVTLTARTRDGRSSTTTLAVRVTACESCGN